MQRSSGFLFLVLGALGLACASEGPASAQPPPPSQDAGPDQDATPGDALQEPEPEVWEPGPLRVASWNTQLFFDDVKGNCPGCKYEERVLTGAEYTAKLRDIGRGLAELDADLVLLQEVENEKVLDDLVKTNELSGLGYQHTELVVGNDPSGINIGVISRVGFNAIISHKDDQFTRLDAPEFVYRFARDALELHMSYRGKHVVAIGVHFKSKTSDDPDKRLAEAQHTRAIIDGILDQSPDAYVLVAGDYNDGPGSAPYLWLRDGVAGPVLENPLATIPTAERYTYEYGASRQLVDNMMVDPAMGARFEADSATILHDNTFPSDHAPIAATYTIP